jgi:type VI secretion system secreted protein VgrG
MKTSQNGIDILKNLEGCRLTPYDDQTGDDITEYCKGATIGIGHLIKNDEEFELYRNGITQKEATDLLIDDLADKEGAINNLVKIKINQNQFDSLLIFVYNIGVAGFMSSSVLKCLNEGRCEKYPSLEMAWKAWNKSHGKIMNELIARRNAEWILFNS